MKTRDTQRARVYRADAALNKIAPRLPKVADVERFTKKVWSSERVKTAFPLAVKGPHDAPEVKDGRGCRIARGGTAYIIIPCWARDAGVVLHELAHTVTLREYRRQFTGLRKAQEPAAHGWEFCANYLKLTLYTLGREAHDALKAAFKEHGVRYQPKRQRAPMSEEQRQACAARLAAARAKRQVVQVATT